MAIATINPTTGKMLKTFEQITDAEVLVKLDLAHRAFALYRQTGFSERSQWLQQASTILA